MSTDIPWFFGYGSLVNLATHTYPDAQPATLTGWQRRWVHATGRPYAFLSVEPAQGVTIHGLVAAVPGGDWAALDLREASYVRQDVSATVQHALPGLPRIATYRAEAPIAPTGAHPVLLSYIDTVMQGFVAIYGEAGPREFFGTTQGWDVPILNDRAAPIYPRAQDSSPAERALVDDLLRETGVEVKAA